MTTRFGSDETVNQLLTVESVIGTYAPEVAGPVTSQEGLPRLQVGTSIPIDGEAKSVYVKVLLGTVFAWTTFWATIAGATHTENEISKVYAYALARSVLIRT